MSTVTVIGTGNMGSAIAAIVAKGGASVQILDRDTAKAETLAGQVGGTAGGVSDAATGDIIILAVPYAALAELAGSHAEQWKGKTVVDITNPVDFATFDGMEVPADSSAAAQLAELLPGAHVVKAFNTNLAATLVSGQVGDVPTTVLLAGDDDSAKAAVRSAIEAGGLSAADGGSLKRARELEAMGFLQMVLASAEQVSWAGGFAIRS